MQLLMKSLVASTLLAAGTLAQAEISANFGATSEYIWRGVSQSDGTASVSGGIDYADDTGFYAGTWVGSLGDTASGFNGSEVDLYFGYATDNFDIGYIYYWYPSVDGEVEFAELYTSYSVSDFTFGLAYTTNAGDANEDAGFDTGDVYYYASYGTDLSEDWSIGFTLGAYTFDHDQEFDNGELDYVHYSVDLGTSTDLGDFTFTLSDTDIDDDDVIAVVSWGIGF